MDIAEEARTLRSLSIRRVLVVTSSVVKERMSSGMSLQVSSGGWSGVVSMALAESAGDDDEACVSGFFSLFVLFCSGGGLGGCAEDMVRRDSGWWKSEASPDRVEDA